MQVTTAGAALRQFRDDVYATLGHRKDTLFELMEAVLVSAHPTTLVRQSLEGPFRRGWSSAPDALADGTLDVPRCQRVLGTWLAQQAITADATARPVWALDGSMWPRPAASTSPERTFGHWTSKGTPQAGIIPGWEYQWLVDVPETTGSWVRPLDVTRRSPTCGTPTTLAITQLRTALGIRPLIGPRPVVTADSGYDAIEVVQAHLAVDVLARLPRRRRFFRAPPPYAGRGTPRKHGPVFNLRDATTWDAPDHHAQTTDSVRGQIQLDVWDDLHDQHAPQVRVHVVRIQVERLAHAHRASEPLWLVWTGATLPDDLLDLWRWYQRRFVIEHSFRFLKQTLGWTTIRPGAPEAADRWSWLLALGLWQLWLARALVADQRLPWEHAPARGRLTPGRVQRAFAGLLSALSTPTRAVRRRGKSPGRRPGTGLGARTRYPVVRRPPKQAA